MESTEKQICPCCGKAVFTTKGRITRYIISKGNRTGGDRCRSYYSNQCGCFHLTTKNKPESQQKKKQEYNRLEKKFDDVKILKTYGLA